MTETTSQSGGHSTTRFWLAVTFVIILIQIVSQYLMGRIWICECGYVKLFEAGVNTPGNSQHIFDWYTPSHIIHGFLFYGLGWLVMRRKPLTAKLALAALIEAGWEILENSPIVIDRDICRAPAGALQISIRDGHGLDDYGLLLRSPHACLADRPNRYRVRDPDGSHHPGQPDAQRRHARLADRGGEDLAGSPLIEKAQLASAFSIAGISWVSKLSGSKGPTFL